MIRPQHRQHTDPHNRQQNMLRNAGKRTRWLLRALPVALCFTTQFGIRLRRNTVFPPDSISFPLPTVLALIEVRADRVAGSEPLPAGQTRDPLPLRQSLDARREHLNQKVAQDSEQHRGYSVLLWWLNYGITRTRQTTHSARQIAVRKNQRYQQKTLVGRRERDG